MSLLTLGYEDRRDHLNSKLDLGDPQHPARVPRPSSVLCQRRDSGAKRLQGLCQVPSLAQPIYLPTPPKSRTKYDHNEPHNGRGTSLEGRSQPFQPTRDGEPQGRGLQGVLGGEVVSWVLLPWDIPGFNSSSPSL